MVAIQVAKGLATAGTTDGRVDGGAWARVGPLALAFAPVLAAMLAVRSHGSVLRATVEHRPELVLPAVLAVAALATLLSGARHLTETRPLLVGLAITGGIYALALGPDVAVAHGNAAWAERIGPALLVGYWLSVPAALLTWFRPAFAIVPFVQIALHKELTRSIGGATHMGSSDYLPLIEVGLFLAAGACALSLLRRLAGKDAPDPALDASLLLAAAIGAHLGNYFMSGLAKLTLDGGPLSWTMENPTAALMLSGYNLGTAPLAAAPWLFDRAHALFAWVAVPTNALTLLAQLGCALAFLHRRLLIGFALFFDLMHVAIWVLTGAMFVTWIVLNTLIVVSVARLPGPRLAPPAIVLGVLVTVLGHHAFWNARLGWYDAPQARHAFFEAIDREGEGHRVPHSFFREASYLMLGRQFGYLEHARPSPHAPTSSWGQIGIAVAPPAASGRTNHVTMRAAKECAVPVAAGGADAAAPSHDPVPDHDVAAAEAFMRGHHARAVERASGDGAYRYHLYPHHHLAMPFLFGGFDALDPRQIVAYRYVVETVCLRSTPEGLDRRVLHRTQSEEIGIDG